MEKDIFDRIMEMPGLNKFKNIYETKKEIILYLFFGALTVGVSVASFAIFCYCFSINELTSNVFSWIIAVVFAFITNRIWVFKVDTSTLMEFIKQCGLFFSGRIATLILEEIILLVFVSVMQFDAMLVKVIAQVVVIIVNYILSKCIVFKE